VIKVGITKKDPDLSIKRKVYKRLAKRGCPYILEWLESNNEFGLIFEYCPSTIRKAIKQSKRKPKHRPLPKMIEKWAFQAAEGLAVLHKERIIYGDSQPPCHTH